MAKIIIHRKFTPKEAIEVMLQAEKWFADNPKRKVCRTDLFAIRRGYVVRDVFERTALPSDASLKRE